MLALSQGQLLHKGLRSCRKRRKTALQAINVVCPFEHIQEIQRRRDHREASMLLDWIPKHLRA